MSKKQQVCRILFVRTDRMGDVLMNLPAIHLLRQTFPKAWITLLLDKSVADLLRDHPDVDEVITTSHFRLKTGFSERLGLIWKIRKAKFDMAVLSNPDKFFHFMAFFAGIPRRVGYKRKWGFLLNEGVKASAARFRCHEIENNLDLVRLVSSRNWDGAMTIPVDEKVSRDVEVLLARDLPENGPVMAVHAGSSNPAKRWPAEKFAAFLEKTAKMGLAVVLLGGKEEASYSFELLKKVRVPVVDWTGVLTLRQLAAFLNHPRVKTLVTSDSGPMHVAWILGKPVVAFFAKNAEGSSPERWGPRNAGSRVIYKAMNDITVEEAVECLEKILKT